MLGQTESAKLSFFIPEDNISRKSSSSSKDDRLGSIYVSSPSAPKMRDVRWHFYLQPNFTVIWHLWFTPFWRHCSGLFLYRGVSTSHWPTRPMVPQLFSRSFIFYASFLLHSGSQRLLELIPTVLASWQFITGPHTKTNNHSRLNSYS